MNRVSTRGQSGRVQVLLLLAPAVILLTFALWQRAKGRPGPLPQEAPTAPEDTVQKGPVAGWEKRLTLGDAGELDIRLERLHPHDSRQAFDAKALGLRLGRAGKNAQPWRLVLSSPAPGNGSSEAVGDVLVSNLARVQVEYLEPLVHDSERPVRGGLSDPLRTLFALPEGELRAGQAVDLVFWGEAPEGRATVTIPGLDAHGASPRIELLPLARSGTRASQSIATLDARLEGEGGGR